MSDSGSKPQDIRLSGSARIGRRIGIALFWLLAAYVVGMATFSIVPALYSKAPQAVPLSAAGGDCAAPLDQLENQLRAHTAAHFSDRTPPTMGVWLSAWDRRYAALPAPCGELEETRKELGQLRADLEHTLRRYDAEQGARRTRIRKALDAIAPLEQGRQP